MHHRALFEILSSVLKKKTTAEWIDILDRAGIPCGPVGNVADIIDNEQVRARNMIVSIDYPDIGRVESPGSPIKSASYEVDVTRPAPELGQDNKQVIGRD
jgi:CoA:oxalate CoA-transferase